ncbi:MAG: DNA repair protein RecO [Caldisericia bacterium]|nr:DNA repair protein RecO [Caldisericia bacterium]
MEIVRVKSFILKKLPIKEYDALVFLYCDSLGKIIARAKSCFKKDTKWTSIIETMNLIDTSLYKKREYFYLTETKVLDSYINIKLNLKKSIIALEILNLIDKTQVESNPNIILFNTLINFFENLKTTTNEDSLFINLIFNFIKIEGIQFPLEKCIKCSSPLKTSLIYDFNYNGFVCDLHTTKNFVKIDQKLYYKILKIISEFDKNIIFEKDELEIIHNILSSFLESNFSYRLRFPMNEILV